MWNIPVACDRASADFMISSPLMTGSYERTVPDYTAHNDREIPGPEAGADEAGADEAAGEEAAGEDPAGEREDHDRASLDPALGSIH